MMESKTFDSHFFGYDLSDDILCNDIMWRRNGDFIEKEVLQTNPKWNNYNKYDLDMEKPMLSWDQDFLNNLDYSKCFNIHYVKDKGYTLVPNDDFRKCYDKLESMLGGPVFIIIGQMIKDKFEEKTSTINKGMNNANALAKFVFNQVVCESYINVELFIDCVKYNNDGEELCDYYIKSRILYEIN